MEKDLKELELSLRKIGSHQKAEEVNSLLQDYLRYTKMTKNASLVKVAEMPKTEPWPDQADENITYYIELNNQNPEQSTYFGLYKVDARSWQQILGRLGSGAAGALAGANIGGSAGDIASSFAEGAGASQGTKDLADSAVGIAGTVGGGVAGGWAGSKLFDWISKFFRRPFLKATLDQTSNTWKLDGDKSQGLKILADASSKLTGSDQAIANKFKSIVESSSNQSQQSGTGRRWWQLGQRGNSSSNVTQAPAKAPAEQTNTGQNATGPTPRQTGPTPRQTGQPQPRF